MTIQKILVQLLLAAAIFEGSTAALAAPGEGIVRDPATGNYTVTYQGYQSTQLFHTRFIPATKIDPLAVSSFKLDTSGNIVYRYTVINGHKSKQGISSILLDPVSAIVSSRPLDDSVLLGLNNPGDQANEIRAQIEAAKSAIAAPAGWNEIATASRQSGLRIGWAPNVLTGEADGIKPGTRQGGFGFTSTDLPGIQIMQLSSSVAYPDDPTDPGNEFMDPKSDIAKQYYALVANDFVPRFVAVPAIHVTNRADVASLLHGIQIQSQSWVGMQLLDPALSSQFDRLYQSALDASTRNNPKAVTVALGDIRKLLKKEHEDLDEDRDDDAKAKPQKRLIDKLAARVLDFDLRYVERHLGAHEDY